MTLDYRQVALDLLTEVEGQGVIGDYIETSELDKSNFDVRFACTKPGYSGWIWEVTFSRPDKKKTALVSEVNLVAGPDALLAPAWVPWTERLAEFRRQLKLEGKAETDDEADALIADMAGAQLVDSAALDHNPADASEHDSENGGSNPPAKVRVRQRRIKREHDEQGDNPQPDANQDDSVGSSL